MLESGESTVVSSQGSSNLVDSSSQQMDTDYDDLEPPLTISTDEVGSSTLRLDVTFTKVD